MAKAKPSAEMDIPTLRTKARELGVSDTGTKKGLVDRVDAAEKEVDVKQGVAAAEESVANAAPATPPIEVDANGRPRAIVTRMQTEPETPGPVKQRLAGERQTYDEISNPEAIARAKSVADADEATARNNFGKAPLTDDNFALGVELYRRSVEAGRHDEAADILSRLDDFTRTAGRAVQITRMLYELTGRGYTRVVDRTLRKIGKTNGLDDIDPAVRAEIEARAQEAYKLTGDAKAKALKDLNLFVADNVPTRWWEWLNAYRYSNMLSSPRATMRNMTQNAVNTFLRQPINMVLRGRPKEAATWLRNVSSSMAEAWDAGKQVMKSSAGSVMTKETGDIGGDIASARRANLPRLLRVVGDFMEAQDRFFGTMIRAAEFDRLARQGMEPKRAVQMADATAERFLSRGALGSEGEDASKAIRAVDTVGAWMEKAGTLPVAGPAFRAVMPFIRVPTNAFKNMLRNSIFGLGGALPQKIKQAEGALPYAKTPERAQAIKSDIAMMKDQLATQRAEVLAGSIVTAAGGLMAYAGNTTWSAPKDPEERKLWYASGRQPYSVLIGNRWVPMWYLGPYAFAFAIPAAAFQEFRDNPKSATAGKVEQMTNVARDMAEFYVSQTPMQGMGSLFKMMDRDEEFSFGKLAAFTAGQLIPAEGLVRWVNTIVDPAYRKAVSFKDAIKKDIPGLSLSVDPYEGPGGTVAERRPADQGLIKTVGLAIAPYDLKKAEGEYEGKYQGERMKATDKWKNNRTIDTLLSDKANDREAVYEAISNMAQTKAEFQRLKQRANRKRGWK